jgi:hypothetical protein
MRHLATVFQPPSSFRIHSATAVAGIVLVILAMALGVPAASAAERRACRTANTVFRPEPLKPHPLKKSGTKTHSTKTAALAPYFQSSGGMRHKNPKHYEPNSTGYVAPKPRSFARFR